MDSSYIQCVSNSRWDFDRLSFSNQTKQKALKTQILNRNTSRFTAILNDIQHTLHKSHGKHLFGILILEAIWNDRYNSIPNLLFKWFYCTPLV